ncbi:PTS sugar transporter subunit IIC [Streptococcus rifensis]
MDLSAIQKKYQPLVNKMSNNRYLKAIMNGMMGAMPVTLIGSLAALIKQFPIESYQNFLTETGLSNILQLPITFTTNFLALIFVFTITNAIVESFNRKGTIAAVIAVVSFMILTPVESVGEGFNMVTNIPMTWLGSTGLFSALIVSIIVGRLFVWITDKGWTIKMPASVPPFITDSFAGLVPGVLIVALFVVIAGLMSNTSYGSIHQLIYGVLQIPLQSLGGNIWAILIVALIGQILWFFGIHGTMVTFGVIMPIWMAMDVAQLNAYSNGQPLPNIVGLQFFMIYCMGGTAIGLVILMLLSKTVRYKTLGKLAVVPAIFGITEPVIFGTPLVLNPTFAIPFIFNNVISLSIAYFLTVVGILPRLTGIGAPTGTPILLNGLITGGWKVALFQVFQIFLWIALWYPFFKIAEKQAIEDERVVE